MLRAPAMKLPALLLVGIALAGILSACARVVGLPAGQSLQVALSEYRLNPSNVRAHPGLLRIVASNFGRLTHNLVLTRDGTPLGATRPLAPGQSGTISVELTAGTYQMSSTALSDQALGAYGTLTVAR